MKKFLLLLYRVIFIIAFFHSAAKAQTIRIVDGMTGKPLELVNVLSFNPEMLSISNPNGEVDISEFTGFDSIQISRLGFLRKWYTYQELTMYVSLPLKLDSLSFPLDTFIISSTRWRQSRRDVPNRIVSITPDDIAIDNAQTAADVLQGSGEVFVQKSQLGGGSPMIRGFSANRVLLTVDGVRMNNAIFRSGNVQNVISIDPQSVNRVEVNYGPGSVIYGSDALGGVLSYFTKGPKIYTTDSQAVSGSALARTSTANQERTGHIEINFDGGKWASLSSITFSAYDDLLMGSNGPSEYLRPEFIVARPEG
ncbi:MAG: TonB-dependent receptor plug domain-containing protein, partial [Bacteroidetes bacterium]|nr:TonB-dependent receptor plug domain-containing protein [Bacteroidota bacterium]